MVVGVDPSFGFGILLRTKKVLSADMLAFTKFGAV